MGASAPDTRNTAGGIRSRRLGELGVRLDLGQTGEGRFQTVDLAAQSLVVLDHDLSGGFGLRGDPCDRGRSLFRHH